jgi:hypothetical protein
VFARLRILTQHSAAGFDFPRFRQLHTEDSKMGPDNAASPDSRIECRVAWRSGFDVHYHALRFSKLTRKGDHNVVQIQRTSKSVFPVNGRWRTSSHQQAWRTARLRSFPSPCSIQSSPADRGTREAEEKAQSAKRYDQACA